MGRCAGILGVIFKRAILIHRATNIPIIGIAILYKLLGQLFRLLISRLAAIEIPTIVPGESLQFQRFLLGFCRPNVIGIHCIVLQV